MVNQRTFCPSNRFSCILSQQYLIRAGLVVVRTKRTIFLIETVSSVRQRYRVRQLVDRIEHPLPVVKFSTVVSPNEDEFVTYETTVQCIIATKTKFILKYRLSHDFFHFSGRL